MGLGIMTAYNRCCRNVAENARIMHLKILEKKKINEPRRVSITNTYQLSNHEKSMIDEFYLDNYGKKIPYTWHQHYSAFTGMFDVNFFPEILYIAEMQRFMNQWPEYCRSVSDKSFFSVFADAGDVLMPENIVICSKNMFRNSKYEMISKEDAAKMICGIQEIFVKPTVDSNSGNNCMICHVATKEEAFSLFEKMGMDFVIQERLQCHETISNIYAKSVNTFRVITYRWKDDILLTPSVLRIGRGGNYLDNAHAGGIFIAIDDDGTLHDTAYTEFKNEFKAHPDTKFVFSNYKICQFPKVLNAALRMHQMLPQIGIINWDFTIDKNGNPVVLEANVKAGSIWLSQMSHGKGIFGDKTPEILQWLRFMEKQNICDRNLYAFGRLSK